MYATHWACRVSHIPTCNGVNYSLVFPVSISSLHLAAVKQFASEDPRRFGLALRIMCYLLAEVLKGLAYM